MSDDFTPYNKMFDPNSNQEFTGEPETQDEPETIQDLVDLEVSAEVAPVETEEEDSDNSAEEDDELTSSDQLDDVARKGFVDIDGTAKLNLRAEPANGADVVEQLLPNTELTILEDVDDEWIRVSTDEAEGYVKKLYVTES